MAEFESENLATTFTVSDKITVDRQLAYNTAIFEYRTEEIFWRQFLAALVLVEDWESAVLPEPNRLFKTKIAEDEPEDSMYLDELTDPRVTSLIIWVGSTVGLHVSNLEEVSKNL